MNLKDNIKYRRIILKISGEYLIGKDSYCIDKDIIMSIALQIKDILDLGVEIGIVIGGGNILRGSNNYLNFDRAVEDYMGMLATIINALALQETFKSIGVDVEVQSAIPIGKIAQEYSREKSLEYLTDGKIVIFASGTGNPFFTTDTAAVLRGLELNCDIILKATNVEGIYDEDPKKNVNAKRFNSISFDEAILRQLKVMDATAFTLCRDEKINIIVFGIYKFGSLKRIILGEEEGTLVFC